MTLLAYRLRPLPGKVLTGLPIVLLVAAWWLAPRLEENEAIGLVQFTAVPLGLVAAFSVSRDVDPPEPVLASVPHPYWRTPALRASLWVIVAATVVGLIGDVIDARVLEPMPVDAAVALARADLVLVAGLAFAFSIRWGSFIGGASALVGLVTFALAQRLWRDWPLRVLDTVAMPDWEQTRAWFLFTGTSGVVAGLLYLRARGLPGRHLFVWVMAPGLRRSAQSARRRAHLDLQARCDCLKHDHRTNPASYLDLHLQVQGSGVQKSNRRINPTHDRIPRC